MSCSSTIKKATPDTKMGDMKEAQEKCKLDFLENFSRSAPIHAPSA